MAFPAGRPAIVEKEGFDGKEWASPDGTSMQRKEGWEQQLRLGTGVLPGSCVLRVARPCCPLFSYALNSQFLVIEFKGREAANVAKSELTAVVEPKCQRMAEQLGYELVDVDLDKEDSGKYLRIYIDKPEGITLDDCEKYHRAIQPQLESYDYDFLEVSSPGIDRPLKKDRDFERAMGMEVEIRLFKAIDGCKEFTGELTGYDKDEVVLMIAGEEKRFGRRAASLIKPVVDMDGVADVDLGGDDLEVGDEVEVEEE